MMSCSNWVCIGCSYKGGNVYFNYGRYSPWVQDGFYLERGYTAPPSSTTNKRADTLKSASGSHAMHTQCLGSGGRGGVEACSNVHVAVGLNDEEGWMRWMSGTTCCSCTCRFILSAQGLDPRQQHCERESRCNQEASRRKHDFEVGMIAADDHFVWCCARCCLP